ncbi:hypothetical protein CKM354_000983100 [Cercospora kikuchii]|uniref:PA14 domain-containing protein n=1 Tax=Cercospora kikuchii TaxID=84275 RepID=A0A9P3CSG0_9PEZI|nr:uncharacterized protein CKM354_000983100 [Cercospora kikuchii]GIZ46717.1 hypothetical protein CKM354_000983100 [Cercospora kikuchii]
MPVMAGFEVVLVVFLSASALASPQWHYWGSPTSYNNSCRAAAPYISALRTYDAASSLCSSVLGLTAQTVTEACTELTYINSNQNGVAVTATYTASASTIRASVVTITGNTSTTTIFSNTTRTITRPGPLATAPTSTSYTTLTSTSTICGNSSEASDVAAPVKRQFWGWGGKPHWHHDGPGHGWRQPQDLPPSLEDAAESAISSACSCMSLPVERTTITARTTNTTSVLGNGPPTASATYQPILTWANTTIIRPVVTRTATSTRTIRSSATLTPVITSTIVETTTVLIGQQFGTPTVVLASPTPITGVDGDGLATQDFDDERYPIELPFPIELYGTRTRSVVVAVNGWISLGNDSGTVDHYSFNNAQLPRMNSDDDWGLPDTVFLPYWNDLFIAQGTAQGLYYEIAGTSPNRNVSFEWYTSLYQQPTGYYHFIATFQESTPGAAVFTYYQANGEAPLNTGKYGTIGVQSFLDDRSRKYSYDRLVAPGLEITYDPEKDVFLRTNSVNCVLSS